MGDGSNALQTLVDADDQPVFALDRDLRYTAFNRAHAVVMRALYGADIAIGKRLLDYQTVEEDRAVARANLERALRGERVVEEALSGDEESSRLCFEVTHTPILDGGEVVGVAVRARDVTASRRAEERARESEDRFRYVFDFSPLGKSITLPTGEVNVNAAFCRMVGRTREELEHARWQDISHPDDLEMTQRRLEPLLSGVADEARFEKRYLHSNGSTVWADVATRLRRDESGKPLYFVTVAMDITERKRAEQDLRASGARYRALVDHMSSGVVVYEPTADGSDFVIREFNDASQRIEDIGRAAVVGKRVTEAFPGVDAFGLLEVLRRVARTGEPETFPTALYRDERLSSWRDNYVYRLPSGEVIAVYDDVTERVRAEQEIARAKSLLERAEEISRSGGWEYDVASGELTWTDEVYRLHGVARDFDPNDIGRDLSFYAPESEPAVSTAFARAVSDGQPFDLEAELDRADGERTWVRTIGRPVVEDGAVVRVTGNLMDITERKRAEQALAATELGLRRIYDAGLIGIIYWNTDGDIVDANDRFLRMVGYSREELEAGEIDWIHMTPPEFGHLDAASVEELRATGANAHPFEKEYVRKDGTRLPIVIAGAMLDDEGYNGIALALDISEQKRAEEALRRLNAELEERVLSRTAQLAEANKELEAFAYSVSHDLRAPLRHISAYSSILAQESEGTLTLEGQECLESISSSVLSMGVLIDDLLQFSRIGRAAMQIGDVDMEQTLSEAVEPLRREALGRTVEWSIGRLPHVSGDPTLLRLVWTNLVDNALKYSREREPARIAIGVLDEDSGDAGPRGDPGEVVFFVRDNGVGFDMKYAHKLFGVFQRLHDSSRFEGTGIGLANVQRIVGRHDGRVWVEAEPDHGACFYFALPRHREAP